MEVSHDRLEMSWQDHTPQGWGQAVLRQVLVLQLTCDQG